MGGKKKNKRKNSSEGDSAKTSKSNKEAKTGLVSTPEGTSGYSLNIPLQSHYSPGGLSGLPINMNNSVFATGATGSPLSQQVHGHGPMQGQMGYPISGGAGYSSPSGLYSGIPPLPFNMGNVIPTAQSTPQPGQGSPGLPSGTNAELMEYLSRKFDEVHQRLGKLDLLEKRVEDIDSKVTKLWSDLDARVKSNAANVTRIDNQSKQTDSQLKDAQKEISSLREQNKSIKNSLNDIQSKAMINNLIIGGVEEVPFETEEQTRDKLGVFFRDDLQVPEVRLKNMKVDRVQRIGPRLPNKPRKILAAFADNHDKNYVKSFRKNIEDTQMFMQKTGTSLKARKG